MSKLALLAATLMGAAMLAAAGCGGISGLNAAVNSRDPRKVLAFAAQNPNIKTAYGNTVRTIDLSLYVAANRGDLAMVRALVAEGADPRMPP